MPKHDDDDTCVNCGKPVRFWDGNFNHSGAHWYHTGRTRAPGEGRHPQMCDETVAEVSSQ